MSGALIQEVTAAILAVVTVLGAFLIVFYDTVNGKPIEVPMWVTLLIGALIGSYYTHTAATNGARKAGLAAAQAAVNQVIAQQADKDNAPSTTPSS